MRIARGSEAGTSSAAPSYGRAKPKNGPTVCDGVGSSAATSVLHRRGLAAAQDDVEAIRERPLGHRRVEVERAHEALAGGRVAHGVEDRVLEEERIAREVHLGDEPR